jgi:hypothetical protein
VPTRRVKRTENSFVMRDPPKWKKYPDRFGDERVSGQCSWAMAPAI